MNQYHIDQLKSSGLDDAYIATLEGHGWKSVNAQASQEILQTQYGKDDNSGLAIPFYDIDGDVAGYRIRLDTERDWTDKEGKRHHIKYLQAQGTSLGVYLPSNFELSEVDANTTVYICEGEKKAECLASLGFASIGLTGVSTWSERRDNASTKRTVLADIVTIASKADKVVVVFDNDIHNQSKTTLRELAQFVSALHTITQRVAWVSIPEGAAKGVDDFLAANGPEAAKALISAHIPAEPSEQLKSNIELPRETRIGYARSWLGGGKRFQQWIAEATESKKIAEYNGGASQLMPGEMAWLAAKLRDADVAEKVCGSSTIQLGQNGAIYLDGAKAVAEELIAQVQENISLHLRPNGWEKKFQYADTDIQKALLLVAKESPYRPVQDYLLALPPWDGYKRWANLHRTCLGTPTAEDIGGILLRKWAISAVARAMQPGCKVDTMLILQGTQGQLKSSFFKAVGGEFCNDSPINFSDKDGMAILAEAWIFEVAELATALKSRSQEEVKAFLSRSTDTFRAAYARSMTTIPRSCVLTGTTNNDVFLTDQTGNRRYWVVHTGAIDLAKVKSMRDQLWAEALWLYRVEREEWWLNADQTKQLNQVLAPCTSKSTIEEWADDNLEVDGSRFSSMKGLQHDYKVYMESRGIRERVPCSAELSKRLRRLFPDAPEKKTNKCTLLGISLKDHAVPYTDTIPNPIPLAN